MDDDEIIALVASVAGCPSVGATVQTLGGRQGLLVCRLRFAGGRTCIFKAVRESAQREVALTEWLGRRAPDYVPATIAADMDRRRRLYWLVTEDLGDRRLVDSPTPEGYGAAARVLGALQIATLHAALELEQLGVPVMTAAQWEDVALRVAEAAERAAISRDEQTRLADVVWSVSEVAACAAALPVALVHGDAHGGNIAIGCDGAVRLLDWGSAYLGAAWLALEELLWPASRHLPAADALRVRSAYVKEWFAVLGKPGRFEPAAAACRVLVRLGMLDELMRRGAGADRFQVLSALGRLCDAGSEWRRPGVHRPAP